MPKDSKGSIVPSSSIKGKKYANFEPTIEAPLSPPVIVDGDGTNRSGSALNVYEERYQGTREGRSPKTRVKSSPGGEHKAAGRQTGQDMGTPDVDPAARRRLTGPV